LRRVGGDRVLAARSRVVQEDPDPRARDFVHVALQDESIGEVES
jgi:hypothetical protein